MSHLPTFGSRDSRVHGTWTALPDSSYQPHIDHSTSSRHLAARTIPERDIAEHDPAFGATSTNDPRISDGATTSIRDGKNLHAEHHDDVTSRQSQSNWRPFTLRPYFLGSMAVISLALAITLAVLCWYSVHNHGLRQDTDTPGLLIVRRYLPTILAVFFTQAMVMISNDIKRTEPFARLARSEQFDVEQTLLYTSKAWWSTFREGCMRKRNLGRVNWILVLSSLATGISILALSSLSSSLLAAEQVALRSNVDMQRFDPFPMTLEPRRQVYFHTTSGFLFNASTSMWVSDDYVVSPFGTKDLRNYSDYLAEGTWEMETKVLQMESSCSRMQFDGFVTDRRNRTNEVYDPPGPGFGDNSASYEDFQSGFVNQSYTEMLTGFTLDSDEGCRIKILAQIRARGAHRIVRNGGLYWTNLSSSYITYDEWGKDRGFPVFSRAREWSPLDLGVTFDFSDACIGRNLLIVTTPWKAKVEKPQEMVTEGFQVRAELCTPRYFEAITNVTASVTSDAKKISLDVDGLRARRSEVSNDRLDMDKIQEVTFGRGKLDYLHRATTLSSGWAYEGVSEALSARYSFSITAMLESNTLAAEAAKLGSRFFNELVFSGMTEQQNAALKSFPAQSTKLERRLVVVTETAATLSVLLLLFACYLLLLCRIGSSRRRPLRPNNDPATTFSAGAYMQRHPGIHQLLHKTQISSTHDGESGLMDSTEYAGYQSDKTPYIGVKGYTGMLSTMVMCLIWLTQSEQRWTRPKRLSIELGDQMCSGHGL